MKIEEALVILANSKVKNYAKLAKLCGCHPSTLSRRFNKKTRSREEFLSEELQVLPAAEEEALIEYIKKLSKRGLHLTPNMLKSIVEERAQRFIGKNWAYEFIQRQEDYVKSLFLYGFDRQRHLAESTDNISVFYKNLESLIQKHRIKAENIWNFDEKGFLIGLLHKTKRIVPIQDLRNRRVLGTLQDGSREFITVLACVNATGEPMAPTVVFAAESGDLQDSWLENYDMASTRAFFAATATGWTNNDLALAWLDRFARETAKRAVERSETLQTRLLIIDGHGSHLTTEFIDKAIAENIYIAVFPPHSTHRLQPLDVSVFSPLATAYSQVLNDFIHQSGGFSRVTKRVFWSLFEPAWLKAVSEANILSGWRKTGLEPWNPSIVLDTLRIRPHTPKNSQINEEKHVPRLELPETAAQRRQLLKAVRERQKEYNEDFEQLVNQVEHLSFENELLHHQNRSLEAAFLGETKRRKRGKAAGLTSPTKPKFGQIFSPERVQRTREAQHEKQLEEERQKAQRDEEKLQKQIHRQEEVDSRRERAEQRRANAEVKKLAKASEKREKERLREAARQLRLALKAKKPSKKLQKTRKTAIATLQKVFDAEEAKQASSAVTRSGRHSFAPTKFSYKNMGFPESL